jgi:hypothetical protein
MQDADFNIVFVLQGLSLQKGRRKARAFSSNAGLLARTGLPARDLNFMPDLVARAREPILVGHGFGAPAATSAA